MRMKTWRFENVSYSFSFSSSSSSSSARPSHRRRREITENFPCPRDEENKRKKCEKQRNGRKKSITLIYLSEKRMSKAQMPLRDKLFYFTTFPKFSSAFLVRFPLLFQTVERKTVCSIAMLYFLLFHQFFTDQKLFFLSLTLLPSTFYFFLRHRRKTFMIWFIIAQISCFHLKWIYVFFPTHFPSFASLVCNPIWQKSLHLK